MDSQRAQISQGKLKNKDVTIEYQWFTSFAKGSLMAQSKLIEGLNEGISKGITEGVNPSKNINNE
jgi:hypothetical protein